jgi:DNA ligase-1
VLVPFAKAYTGLTDAEIRELDAWIRRSTVEKFGPVRHVKPEHVFELGFEGIQASPRHKSGVAVRFPRILRWRTDKKPEDADTLETLRSLMSSDT